MGNLHIELITVVWNHQNVLKSIPELISDTYDIFEGVMISISPINFPLLMDQVQLRRFSSFLTLIVNCVMRDCQFQ